MTADPTYLVCPACEHSAELSDEEGDSAGTDDGSDSDGPLCPACGSTRAYRHPEPALPDAESEAYVKFDADTADES